MPTLKKIRKSIKYSLLVAGLKGMFVIIRLLPRKTAMGFGAWLGSMAFKIMKRERVKTINNLTIAYGDRKAGDDIAAMAREVWINLGKSGVEFIIKMAQEKPEDFFKNLEVRGEEHLQAAIKKGHGILGLISHMGCWEATALGLPMLGIPAYAIGKKLGNEKLNNLLFESRGKKGVTTLARGSSYEASQVLF